MGGAVAVATFGLFALTSATVLAGPPPPPPPPSWPGSTCTAQDAIGVAHGAGSLGKVIDTNKGCNVGGGTSTTMTGYIAVIFPAGVDSAVGVDAISQPPAGSGTVLDGTYTISFYNCSNGSISDGSGTYTVTGGDYPKTPPTPNNVLTITALSSGATVTCAYQVQNWPSALKSCVGKGCSFTNDLWVSFAGGKYTQVASNSVNAPSAPPPIVSEAPLAIALPILALLLFGGGFYVVVRRRRMATTVQ